MLRPFSLADLNAGRSRAERIAIMEMTTRSSINVKLNNIGILFFILESILF